MLWSRSAGCINSLIMNHRQNTVPVALKIMGSCVVETYISSFLYLVKFFPCIKLYTEPDLIKGILLIYNHTI